MILKQVMKKTIFLSMILGCRMAYAMESGAQEQEVGMIVQQGCSEFDDEMMQGLIASLFDLDSDTKNSFLLYAVEIGNLDLIQLLLQHGASLAVQDIQQRTPLMVAEEKKIAAQVAVLCGFMEAEERKEQMNREYRKREQVVNFLRAATSSQNAAYEEPVKSED